MCNDNCCTNHTYHAIMIFSILSLLLWPNAPNLNFLHHKSNDTKITTSTKGGDHVTSSPCTTNSTTIVMAFLYGAVFTLVLIMASSNFPSSPKQNCDSPRASAMVGTTTTSPSAMIVSPTFGLTLGAEGGDVDEEEGIFNHEDLLRTFPMFAYSTRRPPRMGKGASFCVICQRKFKDGQMVRWLPDCDHLFHVACIGEWLASHKTCPCCRAELELL